MRRGIIALITLGFLLLSSQLFSQIANESITGQSFKGEVTINATPQTVWAVLTDVQKRGSALGYEHEGPAGKLENVGDNIRLKISGDSGTEIVSYAKSDTALRFLWEPDNATYICQERWALAPEGDGTRLTYEERYTESGPQTAQAIAEAVESYNQALAKLKALCEEE